MAMDWVLTNPLPKQSPWQEAQRKKGSTKHSSTWVTGTTMETDCLRITPRRSAGSEKAARQGHPEALYQLFRMYRLGEGTRADARMAYSHLRKLKDHANPEATYYLGDMELSGLGTKRNPKLGAMHVRKAAELGYATAQLRLGMLHFHGEFVPMKLAESYAWTRKAAEQDEPPALIRLSWLHYAGHGVKRDAGQGAEWFDRFTSLPDKQFKAKMSDSTDFFVERFELDELIGIADQPMEDALASLMFLLWECGPLNMSIAVEALFSTQEIGKHGNRHAEDMVTLYETMFRLPASDSVDVPNRKFRTSRRRASGGRRKGGAYAPRRKR